MESFLKSLQEKKIQLVVFDFDQTILKEHTGGSIDVSELKQVQEKISKDALTLLNVLPRYSIHVGIASFAQESVSVKRETHLAGKHMIQKILEPYVPHLQTIPIEAWHGKDKLKHLKNIRCHFPARIRKRHTLLIDDDPKNIETASSHGYLTCHVKSRQGFSFSN